VMLWQTVSFMVPPAPVFGIWICGQAVCYLRAV